MPSAIRAIYGSQASEKVGDKKACQGDGISAIDGAKDIWAIKGRRLLNLSAVQPIWGTDMTPEPKIIPVVLEVTARKWVLWDVAWNVVRAGNLINH